jgi:hypothetical protein
MAAADIVKTEWGLLVGGTGTDDTEVSDKKLWIKALAFAGNADDATCVITGYPLTTAGAKQGFWKAKVSTGTGELNAGSGNSIFFGDKGVPITAPSVKLGHADDRLYIYLKF